VHEVTQQNLSMLFAAQPGIEGGLGILLASGDAFGTPVERVAGTHHPLPGIRAICADMAEEVVGGHVIAVALGSTAQT
jgi:hypothetical protein